MFGEIYTGIEKQQMTRSALLDHIGKLLERDSDRISIARAVVDAIRQKEAYRWTGRWHGQPIGIASWSRRKLLLPEFLL
jgi:hypothetical protein